MPSDKLTVQDTDIPMKKDDSDGTNGDSKPLSTPIQPASPSSSLLSTNSAGTGIQSTHVHKQGYTPMSTGESTRAIFPESGHSSEDDGKNFENVTGTTTFALSTTTTNAAPGATTTTTTSTILDHNGEGSKEASTAAMQLQPETRPEMTPEVVSAATAEMKKPSSAAEMALQVVNKFRQKNPSPTRKMQVNTNTFESTTDSTHSTRNSNDAKSPIMSNPKNIDSHDVKAGETECGTETVILAGSPKDHSSTAVNVSSTESIPTTKATVSTLSIDSNNHENSSNRELSHSSPGSNVPAVGMGSQGAPLYRVGPALLPPQPPSNINNNNNNNNVGSSEPAGRPQQEDEGFAPSGGMRPLKVEDALNYLDQVKLAFGDRPTIYNEFLEIMKTFKAMEIDTPGVIRRVSELFRGCNELILGFNTFLPEGFKIEQKDLEIGGHLSGFPSAAPPSRHMDIDGPGNLNQQQRHISNHGGNVFPHQFAGQQHGPGNLPINAARPGHQHHVVGGNAGSFQVVREAPLHPQRNIPAHAQTVQKPIPQDIDVHQQAAAHQPQQQGGQQPEFDHAITYVTTIKRRFAGEPRTYQQFLEILHTYQKEQRGIREVLEQVSALFADHPDLLKEFTYFLPEAVQEQAKERLHAAAAEAEQRLFAARQYQEAADAASKAKLLAVHSKPLIDMTSIRAKVSVYLFLCSRSVSLSLSHSYLSRS